MVVEVELVDVVDEVVEVDVVDDEVELVVDDGPVVVVDASGGRSNGQARSPFVATVMYRRQIVAGKEPPVTEMPWTLRMKVPSGYPTHTAVVSRHVYPTNHASRLFSVVPVLPADGTPIREPVPVPPSTTWWST